MEGQRAVALSKSPELGGSLRRLPGGGDPRQRRGISQSENGSARIQGRCENRVTFGRNQEVWNVAGVTEEGQGGYVWDYLTGQGEHSNPIPWQQALRETSEGLAVLNYSFKNV